MFYLTVDEEGLRTVISATDISMVEEINPQEFKLHFKNIQTIDGIVNYTKSYGLMVSNDPRDITDFLAVGDPAHFIHNKGFIPRK